MKAVTYHRYGAHELHRLEEVPNLEPKENEILVRVQEAEVTKAECELSSFRFPNKWFWLPLRMAMYVNPCGQSLVAISQEKSFLSASR